MINSLRNLRLLLHVCFAVVLLITAIHYKTTIYLLYQAKGQLSLLLNTSSLSELEQQQQFSEQERENIDLIKKIKKYSVDSLAYKHTDNYTRYYDQKGNPILWVITASQPYSLKAYEWTFPLIGRVSYKGFFNKKLANEEYNHLLALGYDVELGSVSAWSTLGWFSDPVLSNMLKKSKGSLCNLLFHELFHATYYAPNSVDFNENIASFIAHKATIRYLRNDTIALHDYLLKQEDNKLFSRYMLRSINYLKNYYPLIKDHPQRSLLKLKAIMQIADSISYLPLHEKERYSLRQKEMLKSKNAYFVDFVQYDSMQDSLENVFNKIYGGSIKKLAQDLKLN